MKTRLMLLLSFTAALFAADPQPVKDQAAPRPSQEVTPPSQEVKKMGSVTWDLENHKLVWVVQKGTIVNGEFKPSSEQHFEISPDEAVMAASGEMRGFDDNEAASLQHLLDVLSIYCAESVVWWDQGEGTPVDPNAAPPKDPKAVPPAKQPDQKPVRVGSSQDETAPQRRVPVGELVAAALRGVGQ